jgi:hypothetical protein
MSEDFWIFTHTVIVKRIAKQMGLMGVVVIEMSSWKFRSLPASLAFPFLFLSRFDSLHLLGLRYS